MVRKYTIKKAWSEPPISLIANGNWVELILRYALHKGFSDSYHQHPLSQDQP
jgi:hypothetical protein